MGRPIQVQSDRFGSVFADVLSVHRIEPCTCRDGSGARRLHGTHALGHTDDLIRDHPCYLALSEDSEKRQEAYRELFRSQVDEETLRAIRESVNSGLVLGGDQFKDQIEAALARSVRAGKPGRPRKQGKEEV